MICGIEFVKSVVKLGKRGKDLNAMNSLRRS